MSTDTDAHLQQLGKDPKDYPNSASMPSVQVALRLLAKGKRVKAKDVMSFIITGENSGSAESAARHAFTPDEVIRTDSGLKPDIDYYLHKQILPPVERLCAPISGTNITLLAECLGLDTSKYRVSSASAQASGETEIMPLESQVPDEIRFKDSTPLTLRCRACKNTFLYKGLGQLPAVVSNSGITCPHEGCGKPLGNLSVVAQVEAQIKMLLSRYYSAVLICDDPDCGNRTRQMSVYGHKCLGSNGLAQGCFGRMGYEIGEKWMYNQLLYFSNLFDVDKAKEKAGKTGEQGEKVKVLSEINRERFGTVKDVVKGYLDRNGRQWVQMDTLFGFAMRT